MNDYYAYITKTSDLQQNIAESLRFVHFTDHIHNDSTVFIKPNFTYPFYKEGITTNPQVLKEIMEMIIKDRADQVIARESDGGNHSFYK